MATGKGIYFVYRSHYEGPLSRRVRRIDAPSILAWFQEKMKDARSADAPRKVADADLGGHVYGFSTVLEAAKEQRLPVPHGTAALEELLLEHLYVEGGPENIRLTDHTLRVRTDDDEVELAYFFFDDEAARLHPDRVAWLLQEDPRLPDGGALGTFTPPFEASPLLPAGNGEGTTWAVLLTFHDGETLPGHAWAFPGVRLPDLPVHLVRVVPYAKPATWSPAWRETWPLELRLLRAFIGADEDFSLESALRRAAAFPISALTDRGNHSVLGIGRHKGALEELTRAARDGKPEGDPSRTIVHVGKHVAVLCAHASSFFGYQQWILFDDRWAAAHRDLASSLLWYAHCWDPFHVDPAAPPAKVEPAQDAEVEDTEPAPRPYRIDETFARGDRVQHKKFGIGLVERVEPTKIEVLFQEGARILAHGVKS